MRRFRQSLALFMASGIVLGPYAVRSVADESNISGSAAPAKSEQEIKCLIDRLGSNRFEEREQASQELLRLGKSALYRLKEAMKSPDAEVRRRAQQLVERIERPVRSTVSKPEPVMTPGKSYL